MEIEGNDILCKVSEEELKELRKIEDEDADLNGVLQRFFATAMATQGNIRQKRGEWFAKVKAAHGLNIKDPTAQFSVNPDTGEIRPAKKVASGSGQGER